MFTVGMFLMIPSGTQEVLTTSACAEGWVMVWDSYPNDLLIGGLEHDWIMTFHILGIIIIPADSYFSEGLFYHQPA